MAVEMGAEERELTVASKLGQIEAVLSRNGEDFRRLERRLFGDEHSQDGGIVGEHEKRLEEIKVWFIRVTTGIAVWAFMTGSGSVSLASLIKALQH